MYLSHYTIACAIRTASQWAGVFAWWELDTMLIAVYAHAYAMAAFMQPLLEYVQAELCRLCNPHGVA